MKCNGCPFNDGITDEATKAQNWGCLPAPYDCRDGLNNGKVWMCHENESRVCSGISQLKANLKGKEQVKYSEWFQGKQTL